MYNNSEKMEDEKNNQHQLQISTRSVLLLINWLGWLRGGVGTHTRFFGCGDAAAFLFSFSLFHTYTMELMCYVKGQGYVSFKLSQIHQ